MRTASIRAALAAAAAWLGFLLVTPAGAQSRLQPFVATSTQGLFLHLSDIHFDPFADSSIVPQLIAAPVEQWQSIFESSTQKGFAQYGQDSNYPLVAATLYAAAAEGIPYDYILFTGDALAHDFRTAFLQAGGDEKDYDAFVVKTLQFVNLLLKKAFPASPLVSTLGNEDATCGDYKLAPRSSMLTALAHDLPLVAANPQAAKDFAIGGFYAIPHPKVPDHDIIVLTDVFWSVQYHDNCDPSGGDPGAAELAWLEWTLFQEKISGRSASLVMHIPPGINVYSSSCPAGITTMWRDEYTNRFLALVQAYQDVLRASYAAHTHMDDFRVVSGTSGTPLLATRINPSVSPIFANNPAFAMVLYNRSDATISDYAMFYLTNLSEIGPSVPPSWQWEYTFTQAYGQRGYTPAEMQALAKRIRTDATVAKSYMEFYASKASSPINAGNLMAYACAQTALTPSAYAACGCPGTNGLSNPGRK